MAITMLNSPVSETVYGDHYAELTSEWNCLWRSLCWTHQWVKLSVAITDYAELTSEWNCPWRSLTMLNSPVSKTVSLWRARLCWTGPCQGNMMTVLDFCPFSFQSVLLLLWVCLLFFVQVIFVWGVGGGGGGGGVGARQGVKASLFSVLSQLWVCLLFFVLYLFKLFKPYTPPTEERPYLPAAIERPYVSAAKERPYI